MKFNVKQLLRMPLYGAFLIVTITSCTHQSQSNPNPEERAVSEKSAIIGSKIDTSLKLKFTTPVRAILEDSKNNFWFGSWEEGVCRFDGKQLAYFTKKDGLSHNQVRTIQEDRNGVMWFENGTGISSYDGEKITTHTDRVYDLKSDWKIEPDDLWFKGDEASGVNNLEGQFGTYRYDGKTFTYLTFPIPEQSISDNNVNFAVTTSAVTGKNGMLWFGTYGAVIGYDGTSFSIIDREDIGFSEDVRHLGIRAIFEDSKGNLWIGDNGFGVFLYDGETTINFTERHGLSKKDAKGTSPALDKVFSIGEDRDGNIWFGTSDNGVWRYDPSDAYAHQRLADGDALRPGGQALTNFSEKEGLTSKGVFAIYKDKQGDLWIGGEGVFKFNGKSFDRIF